MSASIAALVLVFNAAPVPVVIVADMAVQGVEATQSEVLPDTDAPGLPARGPLPQPGTVVSPPVPTAPAPPLPEIPATEAANPEPEGPEIVVSAPVEVPGDPLAEVNEQSYEAIQAADKALVAPIALAYEEILPDPVRDGLRNFLRNLEEPVIAFNYLLQLKPGRALKSVARFTVNSTIGVAGVLDVAKKKPFNLPYTANGFANTFACYGIGTGAYLYLPLVGPTTVRDLIGVTLDRFAIPFVAGPPFNQPYYAIPASTIDALNDRVEIDGQLKKYRDESDDPYAASRDLYLKQRKAEIAAICPKKGETVDETVPPRPGKGRE